MRQPFSVVSYFWRTKKKQKKTKQKNICKTYTLPPHRRLHKSVMVDDTAGSLAQQQQPGFPFLARVGSLLVKLVQTATATVQPYRKFNQQRNNDCDSRRD